MKARIIMFYFLVFSLSLNLVSSKEEKKHYGFLQQNLGLNRQPIFGDKEPRKNSISSEKRLIELWNRSPIKGPEPRKTASFESRDSEKIINFKCFYANKNYNSYSLQPLEKNVDYQKEISVTEADGKSTTGTLHFNFCKNIQLTDNSTFAIQEKDGSIKRLAGTFFPEGDKNEWTELEDGIQIELAEEGDKCKDNKNYSLKLHIICDSDVSEEKDLLSSMTDTIDLDKCEQTIEMKSLYGCSLKSTYLLMKLLQEYSLIFGILFIVLGIMFCIWGYRFLKITIVVISGIAGCYIITISVLSFFPNFITTELTLLACMGISFVLGCGIGFFLKGDIKTSVIILGGFLGYLCTDFVFEIIKNYVEFDADTLRYICMAVCVLIGAFLGYKLNDPIIILSTSLLGGYLIMKGISIFSKNYLDEALLIDLVKNGEWEEFQHQRGGWSYFYLGLWAVLTIVGIYLQCKNKNKKSSSEINK
jgi:hypothetical protein